MDTRSASRMCVALCVVLAALMSSVQASGWNYLDGAYGPNNWTATYPLCGGMKQSPINILTGTVEEKDLGEFTFVGFDENDKPIGATMNISNNGHSIEVALTGDYLVSGAGLGDTAFKAVQYHFHWGSVNSQGSEHTVNGDAYPGEMHIVCYNTKYANFLSALENEDGLTVLGFFLEVQAADNAALAPLFDLVSMIQFEHDKEYLVPPLVFDNILPEDLSSFYRYSGSLTTPPCYEIVTWNVFTTPIMVSEAQLMDFRRQFSNEHDAPVNISLVNTYRPVQPVNDRTIYLNTPDSTTDGTPNSALNLVASYSLIAMVLVKVLASVLEN